eukprot:COSAG05_NODE_24501_length_251_cov_0.664474_1_plen_56_part_01
MYFGVRRSVSNAFLRSFSTDTDRLRFGRNVDERQTPSRGMHSFERTEFSVCAVAVA